MKTTRWEEREEESAMTMKKNKNRLCLKTCSMDMNAKRRKILKNMKIQEKKGD